MVVTTSTNTRVCVTRITSYIHVPSSRPHLRYVYSRLFRFIEYMYAQCSKVYPYSNTLYMGKRAVESKSAIYMV